MTLSASISTAVLKYMRTVLDSHVHDQPCIAIICLIHATPCLATITPTWVLSCRISTAELPILRSGFLGTGKTYLFGIVRRGSTLRSDLTIGKHVV